MNPTGLGVLNVAMLLGLAGVAIPIIIHLLNRRHDPVVDWAAMQFLELSPRERRRLNLAEVLLMIARMALLALVALCWPGRSGRRSRPGPPRPPMGPVPMPTPAATRASAATSS